jgi:tricorn protease
MVLQVCGIILPAPVPKENAMRKPAVAIFVALVLLNVRAPAQSSSGPLLLRQPTVSQTEIAFSYAGDIWLVPRQGGEARRVTAGQSSATNPMFSPDGSLIAYSATVDGNTDVYLMRASGGVAQRLTYHPGRDIVVGWTPDGSKVLVESGRNSYGPFARLYAVALKNSGFPEELPLPIASEGSYSANGARIAYVPLQQWQPAWKRYRGGQTRHIWLANLADLTIEAVPRENSNDFNPMWVGDTIYFLSDRNGAVTLFAYETRTRRVRQVIQNSGLDIKSASAGPAAIVYEQFGEIHLLDLNTAQARLVPIRVGGDIPDVRPRYVKVDAKRFVNYGISPTGVRAVFEMHGEILTVPAEKGDIRNLTNSPAVADRDPAWSPDGKWVAYFSDASGEYQLELRNPTGMGDPKKIALASPPSFYYLPTWSRDSTKIAYTDKRGYLWYVDIDKGGAPTRVDVDQFADHKMAPAWSPDAKWIAYLKSLPNLRKTVYLYSLEQGKAFPVTDGMSDVQMPLFDVDGKYLYFTASTDIGLTATTADLSSLGHPVSRSVYVVILDKTLSSPLPPESDDENTADTKLERSSGSDNLSDKSKNVASPAGKAGPDRQKPAVVKIDIDNITQRVLALPVPPRNYLGMWTGKEGIVFLAEGPSVIPAGGDGPPPFTLQKFDLSTRRTDKLIEGVTRFAISANGEKMLYLRNGAWTIAEVGKEIKPGEGTLKLTSMRVFVDPRAEWKQMYHEAWRIQRDFFYDPGFHGLDLAATEKKYAPWVENLTGRSDLTYLMEEMLGEMTVGHMFVWGPSADADDHVKGGLLGADYKTEGNRYRFTRVYNGENWNPELRAPLTQPGVNVTAGEYLLAVNGRELRASDNLFSFFEATAGKAVTIKVGPNPDGSLSRDVVVVPVENEAPLRNLAWIEDNRRKVDQLSGGRVGYVWLPDTYARGLTNFNRYFFAQTGKEGAVIDERFNQGGFLADYFLDYMHRTQLSCAASREGEDTCNPIAGIFGPKAMIINEYAGSGGDALPWYFRKMAIGPLIGKRTWGGLVGIDDYPELIDGGGVTSPRWAIYGLKGEWEVENRGIQPDYEVELDPKTMAQGRDPQLERAVKAVLDELQKHPMPKYTRPPYPNYHRSPKTATGGR